jgi:glycine dehydrogenase subunit 1
MGPEGLRRSASQCYSNTQALVELLTSIEGVESVFSGSCFHECVLRLKKPVKKVLDGLAAENILGGYALAEDYPELENALLVCATETKTADDLQQFYEALKKVCTEL